MTGCGEGEAVLSVVSVEARMKPWLPVHDEQRWAWKTRSWLELLRCTEGVTVRRATTWPRCGLGSTMVAEAEHDASGGGLMRSSSGWSGGVSSIACWRRKRVQRRWRKKKKKEVTTTAAFIVAGARVFLSG